MRETSRRAGYLPNAAFAARALQRDEPPLVSGNRADGAIDRLAFTQALAVREVGDESATGLVGVFVHGPPSVYRVRLSRPGAAADLALLRRSQASGAFMGMPDLRVGIDTRASEAVAVQPLRP